MFFRLPLRGVLSSAQKTSARLFNSEKVELATGDTRWIDGFRGIASVFVVSSHLIISFKPDLVFTPTPEAAVSFLHWPIIRTPAEGFPWVAIFFVLSGFVNALKPIKLMRNNQYEVALSGIATSAFRRVLRLVLPCTIITTLTWIMAQFSLFQVGQAVNTNWLSSTSPSASATLWQGIHDLCWAFWTTWTSAVNYYDMNQWSMMWFLKGSLALYLILVAVSKLTPLGRMTVVFLVFALNWKLHDDMVGIPTYGGIFFAELSLMPSIQHYATQRTMTNKAITITLLIIGLFLLSFPNSRPEWTPWFNPIVEFGKVWFPEGSNQFSIVLYAGVFFILAAVLLSTAFQAWLVHPLFLWLGKISFPLYLIHGPLLRSVLCWLLYLGEYPKYMDQVSPTTGEVVRVPARLEVPSATRMLFCLPVYAALVLYLSHLWTERVEPQLGTFTKFIEDWLTGKRTFAISASFGSSMPAGYSLLDGPNAIR